MKWAFEAMAFIAFAFMLLLSVGTYADLGDAGNNNITVENTTGQQETEQQPSELFINSEFIIMFIILTMIVLLAFGWLAPFAEVEL